MQTLESRLPAALKERAEVHLNEWSWKVPVVYDAIRAAAGVGLAVIVGDPRLHLPHGVYEYGIDTPEEEDEARRPGEAWGDYVARSAAEAEATIRRLTTDLTWLADQEFIPKDPGEIQWVLYFFAESGGE